MTITDETLPAAAARVSDDELLELAIAVGVTSEATPTWQDLAVCAQTDPASFFPSKGESTREAKAICGGCEARPDCLEYALDNDIRHGIWGGTSERERKKLRQGR